jgi:anti-sigma factor RsiW
MSTHTNHIGHRLVYYIHNELDEKESSYIQSHLETCKTCRDEYELIKKGVEFLASVKPVHAPDELWDSIVKNLPASPDPDKKRERTVYSPKTNH